MLRHHIVTVLCYAVLCCTVQCCVVLCCGLIYCTVLYCTVLHWGMLCSALRWHTVVHCTVLPLYISCDTMIGSQTAHTIFSAVSLHIDAVATSADLFVCCSHTPCLSISRSILLQALISYITPHPLSTLHISPPFPSLLTTSLLHSFPLLPQYLSLHRLNLIP